MGALEGLRVLDMTQYEAGTSCTQALAWLGADVVKVERPGIGDPGRAVKQGIAAGPYGSAYFLNYNSNKRSITIDLQSARGRDLLLSLVPKFDVFVENYGPGVIERLDIGYDVMSAINPGIIYGRVKGFGSSGPYSGYKCYDMVAQAAGGAFSVTGEPDGPTHAPRTHLRRQRHRRPNGPLHHRRLHPKATHRRRPVHRPLHARGRDLLHAHPDRQRLGMGHQSRPAHREPRRCARRTSTPASRSAPTTTSTSWSSPHACGTPCAP